MRIIAVASGKGGVGKSTVAYMIAKSLGSESRTILLDFDVCGPSVGVLMGHTTEKILMRENGFEPIHKEKSLYYLSIAAMIPLESAVVWRAPKKISLLKLFLESAISGNYDYIIIDMPPGITDEHVFLFETVKNAEIIIVTTSQNMALDEASESIKIFKNNSLKIIGLIENMRSLKCPNCNNCISVFSKHGGEMLSSDLGIPYLGHLDYISNIEEIDVLSKSLLDIIKNNSPSQTF